MIARWPYPFEIGRLGASPIRRENIGTCGEVKLFSGLVAVGRRLAKLEVILAIAIVLLVAQVFPGYARALLDDLWGALDFRVWSTSERIVANLAVVVALLLSRYLPETLRNWHERRIRRQRNVAAKQLSGSPADEDYEERVKRDAEWAARAKRRKPFT
jgi:hypothetical protein